MTEYLERTVLFDETDLMKMLGTTGKPALAESIRQRQLQGLPPSKISLLRQQVVMYRYEDGIRLYLNELLSGTTNGKKWSRWSEADRLVVRTRTLKNGNTYLFVKRRSHQELFMAGSFPRWTLDFFEKQILPWAEETLGRTTTGTWVDRFIILSRPGLTNKQDLMATHEAFFRNISWRTMDHSTITRKLFGKENYRKDLVKAVAATNKLRKIITARTMVESGIPMDWVVEYLNLPRSPIIELSATRAIVDVPVAHQRKIIVENSMVGADILRLNDTPIMRRMRRDGDLPADLWRGSVNQVHDRMIGLVNERNNTLRYASDPFGHDLEEPFEYDEKIVATFSKLEGAGYRLARHRKDLNDWGVYMRNCISGYGHQASKGHLLFAVMDGDKMIANGQIRNGILVQLLGRFNNQLPTSTFYHIVDTLGMNGILTVKPNRNTQGWPGEREQIDLVALYSLPTDRVVLRQDYMVQ